MEGLYDLFTGTVTMLYQSVQKIRAMEMERYDLQTGHVTCLHLLYQNPDGLTHKELTARGEIDKAAMSRYLAKLIARGFARVEESDARKYNRKIILTEEGMRAAKDINGRIRRAVEGGSADMTDAERVRFYERMRQIGDNLQNYIREMETDKEGHER